MPYRDKEKQREYNRERMRKARVTQDIDVQPDVCATQDVQPEAVWRDITKKVAQGGEVEFTPQELKVILQWGIDEGRIKVRRKMVERYGLTQRYGPARLDKPQLHELLNSDIKQKKIDSPLYFIGSQARPSFYHSYFAE